MKTPAQPCWQMMPTRVLSCDDCDDDDSSMPVNDADCDGSPTDDDCDDNDPSVTICDPEFAVAWNASAVSLSIDGGRPGADYHWGIVETSNCIVRQVVLQRGRQSRSRIFNLCHPVGQTGGELTYDASYDAVEGESTLFSGPGFAANTTYIVDDRSDGTVLDLGR